MTKSNQIASLLLLFFLSSFAVAQRYEGGDVTALAINPIEPAHILAGGSKGQLWSSDNGTSWQGKTIAPGQIVRHILFDRHFPEHVFVATSDAGNQAGALWVSKDNGTTVQRITALQNQAIRGIAQSLTQPDIFVVVTNQGVYRSNDHTKSWQRISPDIPDLAGLHSVAIHPTNPDTIYIGTYHLPMRTDDGGKTWQRAASQPTGMIDDSDIFSILTDTSNHNQLWMSACSGIYRSDNDGAQWKKIAGIPSTSRRTHQIYRHPVEKNLYFAGTTQGLWRSANGGQTWQLVTSVKLVINAIAAHPLIPDTIYMATEDAGLWRSLDRGITWATINTGIVNRQVGSLYADGETLWAGIVHDGVYGGLFRSQNGKEWKATGAPGSGLMEDVWAIHRNDGKLYAGTSRGLYVQTPAGQWIALSKAPSKSLLPTGKITAITSWGTSLIVNASNGTFARSSKGWQRIHPAAATAATVYQQKLWLGTVNGLFVTSDGKIFQRVKEGEVLSLTTNQELSRQESLFVGTEHGLFQARLFKSDGTTFRARGGGLPTALPIHQITSAENNLLVVTDGAIFQSADQGESWQKLKFPQQATTAVRFKNQWLIGTTADGVIILPGNYMQALQLVAPLASDEKPLIIDNCELCKDSGWESVPAKGIRPCPLCALKKAIPQTVSNTRIPARYQHCTVENFTPVGDTKTAAHQAQKAALEATKTLIASYPENKRGLLLLGPCGIGKTHLAVAAGLALQAKGATVKFYDFRELLKLIQESYNSEERTSEWKLLAPARNAEVLILDELGAARPTDWALDTMTQIINQRYNDCRLTILTSNFSDFVTAEHPHTLIDRVGPRIRSRLREMCVTVEVSGRDYREKLERDVVLREAA